MGEAERLSAAAAKQEIVVLRAELGRMGGMLEQLKSKFSYFQVALAFSAAYLRATERTSVTAKIAIEEGFEAADLFFREMQRRAENWEREEKKDEEGDDQTA